MINYRQLAVDVLHDWLVNQFEDADLAAILNDDPDGVQLLDEDFDMVLSHMRTLKANIKLV